jgi:hypothetical protein
MGSSIDVHSLRRAGIRLVLGPVLTGSAGLIGGVLAGWLGGWAALAMFGPFEVEDPWNLFGNAIGLLLPMMLMAAGIVVGFLAGTVILPSVLMFGLTWEKAGRTVLFLLLLLVPVVPLTLWLLVEMTSSSSSHTSAQALVWVGAAVIGGLTPAAARVLATRSRRLPATREGET